MSIEDEACVTGASGGAILRPFDDRTGIHVSVRYSVCVYSEVCVCIVCV